MVWIAFSGSDMPVPYFRKSRFAIDQYVDRLISGECLEPFLLPLTKYHKKDNFLFWQDRASAHYAFLVQDLINSEKFPFVLKDISAEILPRIRPSEDLKVIL